MRAPGAHGAPLRTRMLQGIGLAAFLTLFRLCAGIAGSNPLPIRALTVLFGSVALGGGVGGAAYYATDAWRFRGGWRKTAANVGALLAYAFATAACVALAALLVPSLSS